MDHVWSIEDEPQAEIQIVSEQMFRVLLLNRSQYREVPLYPGGRLLENQMPGQCFLRHWPFSHVVLLHEGKNNCFSLVRTYLLGLLPEHRPTFLRAILRVLKPLCFNAARSGIELNSDCTETCFLSSETGAAIIRQ